MTKSVTVENEKLANIEILSDVAVITAGTLGNTTPDDKATTSVKISNQYGEDITKLNTGVSINVAGAGTAGTLKTTGELDLDIKDTAKVGDLVIVTIVDTATGVSTTKSLTLSDKAAATEVEVGELYNKDGKTLSQDSDVTKDKFYLPITVKDQYGNAITDPAKATNITVTSANPAVAGISAIKSVKINDKDTLVVEITSVGLEGSSNVIAVSTTSGKSSTGTITVAPGVKVANIALSSPAELVTANKDVYFPLTVVDSNGNEVKTKAALNKIKDNVSTSTGTIVDENAAGEKGLFVRVTSGVTESTPLTVVVTSVSGKVSTQTVVPKAEAVATVVTGISDKINTAVRPGGDIVIESKDLIIEDQYGQVIKDTSAIKFVATSSDLTALTATNDGSVDADKKYTIAPVANTTKTSADITFKLLDGSSQPIEASAFTKNYKIVKDADFTGYEIADVKPVKVELNNPADATSGYKVSTGYEQAFKVTAKNENGATVTLTDGADYTVQGVTVAGGKVTVPGTLTFGQNEDTVTKTVTVVINNTGEEFTKELTFSKAAAKTAKIQTLDKTSKKDKTEVKVAGANTAFDYAALHALVEVVATDQYGVETKDATVAPIVTFSPVSGTVDIDTNGTTGAKIENASKGAVVNAKLTKDGQSVTVKLTFDDAIDTVKPEGKSISAKAAGAAFAANDTITITFSEAVKVDDITLGNLALDNGHVYADATDDATITPVEPNEIGGSNYADTFTIKLGTATTVAAADKITIGAAHVTDVAGNTAAAPVVFTIPAITPAP